ncbi:MAG TPA: sigma 54-interacting transcriptional regulator [Kofleriaceae bacterium]|jgi:sigma-54 specific flagellar transcriptional regulator A
MQDLTAWRTQFASEIVGESPEILDALETLRRVAATDAGILIQGETGSGKELFARAVHRASKRKSNKFIPINCAAIPESLLESELFGHIKGAFTGAVNARPGRFMSAHEGTIFLDEIGDLPLSAQAKLLRVLEERVVSPVGSDSDIPVDVRVIAATHRNLQAMVDAGTFRADLYFRLAVVPVELPALRERPEDIIRIAELCIGRSAEKLGRTVEGLDDAAKATLLSYSWPGNVRELAHMIERAVLLTRGTTIVDADLQIPGRKVKFARATPAGGVTAITPSPVLTAKVPASEQTNPAIPLASITSITPPTEGLDLRSALENLERELIDRALRKAGGNRTEAAALLGLNRTTLVEKLRKYAPAA